MPPKPTALALAETVRLAHTQEKPRRRLQGVPDIASQKRGSCPKRGLRFLSFPLLTEGLLVRIWPGEPPLHFSRWKRG